LVRALRIHGLEEMQLRPRRPPSQSFGDEAVRQRHWSFRRERLQGLGERGEREWMPEGGRTSVLDHPAHCVRGHRPFVRPRAAQRRVGLQEGRVVNFRKAS